MEAGFPPREASLFVAHRELSCEFEFSPLSSQFALQGNGRSCRKLFNDRQLRTKNWAPIGEVLDSLAAREQPMNSIGSVQSGNGHHPMTRQLLPASDIRRTEHPANQRAEIEPDSTGRNVRYGLPCTKCRTYYRADLLTCPLCQSTQGTPVTSPCSQRPWASPQQLASGP